MPAVPYATAVHPVNVIDFSESAWGLGLGTNLGAPPLMPIQKFILKAYYGLPLDDGEYGIKACAEPNGIECILTEKGFRDFAVKNGMLNTKELNGKKSMVLVAGARGGKDTLASVIACYTAYSLLCVGSPQDFYGVPSGDRMDITMAHANPEERLVVHNRVSGHVDRCQYLSRSLPGSSGGSTVFPTTIGKDCRRGSVGISFPTSADGYRGRNSFLLMLSCEGSERAVRDIWESAAPILAMWRNPDGGQAGRYVLTGRAVNGGLLYEEHKRSLSVDSGVLSFRLPTWIANPLVPGSYLASRMLDDHRYFSTEFASEFEAG